MQKSITKDVLAKFKKSYDEDFSKAAQNMIASAGIMDASINYAKLNKNPDVFKKTIKIGKMTNQRQSGRCWMFAGLNTIRVNMMKKFKLGDIEFSHKYLYFFDKLERANQYLEDVIALKDKDLDDRLNRGVVFYAADDGAWWTTFARLISKYGIVPEYVYPDTADVMRTDSLIFVLDKRLKIAAKDIRNAKTDEEIDEIKDKALKDVYKITAIALGVPPKRFDLILRDKDNELIERRNSTTAIVFIFSITFTAIIITVATAITNIHRGQSLEILLYGVDTWREAAFYDGIEIVGRSNDAHIVIKFPAERVDFIATHF